MGQGNQNYNAGLNWNNPLGGGKQVGGNASEFATTSAGPLAVAGAVGAVAQGIGAIGSLFGGGSKQESGIKIPQEFEFEMLDSLSADLARSDEAMAQLDQIAQVFNQRMEVIQNSIDAQIPDNELQTQLRDTNIQLAQALGMSAKELAANGFMTEAEAADMEELDRLQSADLTDPRLENDLAEQKARLEQELRRGGASPAVRAQALARFEKDAEEARFTRSNALRNEQGQFIQNKIGIRQSIMGNNINQITGAIGTNQGLLSNYNNLNVQRANLAGQSASMGQSIINSQNAQGAYKQQSFAQLGEYKLSGAAKRVLREGGLGASNFDSYEQLQDYREQTEARMKEAARRRFRSVNPAGAAAGFANPYLAQLERQKEREYA